MKTPKDDYIVCRKCKKSLFAIKSVPIGGGGVFKNSIEKLTDHDDPISCLCGGSLERSSDKIE